jgi:predicted secreted protein
MADKVIGKNIMLYWNNPNGVFFFNGGTSQGVYSTNTYYQLSSVQSTGGAANFQRADSGIIARFMTNVNTPNVTSLVGGTWTFQYYAGITYSVEYNPAIYFIVKKYDGTTFTTIATSGNSVLTDTAVTKYTNTVTIPTTVLNSSDRIVIEVWAANVGARDIDFYTQGTRPAQVTTTMAVDVPFACSTNASFAVNVDQKEVTSQSSAWYREYRNDIASWNLTCDGLITLDGYNYLYLLNLQQSRQSIVTKFAIDNGVDGLVIISGTCNLTSLTINAPYKDIATYSVSLQGSGPYGTSGTNISPSGTMVLGGSIYTEGFTAIGGETTLTYTNLIGKSCLYVSRGGIDVQNILTSGTPTNEDVKWNTLTGVLTFSRVLEAGEYVRALFQ